MNEDKKSDSIEVRMPHAVKQAFMARCRAEGHTASQAIRGFVEGAIAEDGPPPRSWPVRPVAAMGVVATLVASLVLGSASVSAAPDFNPRFVQFDRNHDGVISPAEFGDDSRRRPLPGCGKAELVLPLSRESEPEVRGTRPFAVLAQDFRFAALDLNRDGRISRDEYAAHWLEVLHKGFARFDANHDGAINRHEYAAAYKPAYLGDPPDVAPFLEMDRNRDGRIEWSEFVT